MGTDGGEPPCNTHEFSIGGGARKKDGLDWRRKKKKKRLS